MRVMWLWAAAALAGWLGVASAAEPVRHVVQPGDTLHDLAERYLDDPAQWEALGAANGAPHPLRLVPGSVLLVPADLLRARPGAVRIEHLSGSVEVQMPGAEPRALTRDDRLIDGDAVRTARNGFVTLRLADDSLVRVTGGTELVLQRVGYTVRRQRADTRLELSHGRIESTVVPRPGPRRHRFQVDTPLMSTGVRGTRFGVSAMAERVSTDVSQGRVQTQVPGASPLAVPAGRGASSLAPLTAVALLPAPDLTTAPVLQTRPLIDVAFAPVPGAVAYRAYLARDASLDQVFDNDVFAGPRVRLSGWVDDHYVIAVRAIDENGSEGAAAIHAFELHARPEPPATLAPLPQAEALAGSVRFAWTQADSVAAYDVEVLSGTPDAAVLHQVRVDTPQTVLPLETPGTYRWRIRAVPADGSRPGRFSEPRTVVVRRPVATEVSVVSDDDGVSLHWDGEPGQRFTVQIADDPRFVTPLAEFDVEAPSLSGVALPDGQLYLRVQATDADGFVRSFTTPQGFFVPRVVRHAGGLITTSDGAHLDSPPP
ncbi:FecR domain-containing protein [Achromobacter sp. GG226]|uniref:FecR domain-containing protein n=1 Tax=Verticiella alkaliphila TaxID=2779529 RepID=UPI001C0DEE29|nr:FecR domain-containing protein [Verticiella sp. GG226]MBU4609423.1 FecR domain-containing protein [Verticiella sp. GG226]